MAVCISYDFEELVIFTSYDFEEMRLIRPLKSDTICAQQQFDERSFMYLKRKIDKTLLEWKNDLRHKPLLMRGARQVGKTTAVRRLAESFESFVDL